MVIMILMLFCLMIIANLFLILVELYNWLLWALPTLLIWGQILFKREGVMWPY